jgi:hypothetical protein
VIYVFERSDKKLWADFVASGPIRQSFKTDTEAQIRAVIAAPGDLLPARVKALAQRALVEYEERNKVPMAVEIAKKRSFWGRLTWLVTGK